MADKRYILTPEEYEEYKTLRQENTKIKAEHYKELALERSRVSKAILDLESALNKITPDCWRIDYSSRICPDGISFVRRDEEIDRMSDRVEKLYSELRRRSPDFPYFYYDKKEEIAFAMKFWNSSWWTKLRKLYFNK